MIKNEVHHRLVVELNQYDTTNTVGLLPKLKIITNNSVFLDVASVLLVTSYKDVKKNTLYCKSTFKKQSTTLYVFFYVTTIVTSKVTHQQRFIFMNNILQPRLRQMC